jgi:hypothetical protein
MNLSWRQNNAKKLVFSEQLTIVTQIECYFRWVVDSDKMVIKPSGRNIY